MKQLLTYFSLAYLISWVLWLPLYAQWFGMHKLHIIPFQHGIGALGPLISAFVTTWLFEKQAGVRSLFKNCVKIYPILYFLIALLSPSILGCIAILISKLAFQSPADFSQIFKSSEFPQFNLATFFSYNLLFFGLDEEVGWRGFALPRLQSKLNAFISTLILTFFWAIWHWPLFLYRPGYMSMDIAEIIGWFISLFTGSILLTWLFNSSRSSILICAVFHSTIDIAFTAEYNNINIVSIMGFLITVWGILTIIIFKPKNLSKTENGKSSI